MKLAVFGSGRGSNFQAIINAIKDGLLNAIIVVAVSNSPDSSFVKISRRENIPLICYNSEELDRATHEKLILDKLQEYKFDFIILAGYMKILSTFFINSYPNRIINIHPSLLPSFKGLNAQEQALKFGVKITGVTIHLIDENVDEGVILAQEAIRILENDTINSLKERILVIEHKLLPKTLQEISLGLIKIQMATIEVN